MKTRTFTRDGVRYTEYWLEVPLNHFAPGPQRITVFAREYAAAADYEPGAKPKPYLVFFQGGPGNPGNRLAPVSGWTKTALKDFRVLHLDQRGTGSSTRLDAVTLTAGRTPAQQAEYAGYFRSDQIVADAEAFRAELCGAEPWYTLGQSYGGFITLAYLSRNPEGLRGSLITGGLMALDTPIDELYRETFALTAAANRRYFAAYPGDEATLREIAQHLNETPEYLPSGERLTALRLRGLGLMLGMRTGFDALHFLLEDPFVDAGGKRRLSGSFLYDAYEHLNFFRSPLYGLLHEPIYAAASPGVAGQATNWSAARLREEIPGFSAGADPTDVGQPYYFHAEHIYPELFAADPALQPLAEAADIMARRADWPVLADPAKLRNNEVPVAAAAYLDDIFVPWKFSRETAATVRGLKLWATNEHLHDGLRASDGEVFSKLLANLRG